MKEAKFKYKDKVVTKCSGCWNDLDGEVWTVTYHEAWNRFYYQVATVMGLGWFNEDEIVKI